ncbi:hypothetical protein [Kitasatospora sp. NPDC091276]|uniref:hypothetical protein n=1 Tax=Kitasatospora sp. NPDC091276 TaxID=3155300 RepID=UPI0034364C67
MDMGQRAAGTERIYLSDVEPHAAAPIDRASDLRSRVLLHVLFADTLLIGDSQGLNNRYFRALVDVEEARKVRWSPGTAALSDFGALLEAGRLRVALRAGGTLHRISDGHRAEGVENAPDVTYVERLTGVSSAHTVPYDGSAVAAAFKSGVLTRIEAAERDFAGSAREALEAARAWVSEQDPLLYKQLRDWLAGYRSARPGGSAELVLVLQSVDDWAGESYRRALPQALGVGMAGPRDGEGTIPVFRSRRLVEYAGFPAVMLDNLLLSQLPVEVVFEAIEQPSRVALVAELGRLRRGIQPDTAVLRSAVDEFSSWTLEAFERTFRRVGGLAWEHLRGEVRLMRFGLDEDPVAGRLGAGLEVVSPATDGVRDLSLHVVNGPGAAGPEPQRRAQPRPLRELDPFERVVTL